MATCEDQIRSDLEAPPAQDTSLPRPRAAAPSPLELGGRDGPEPTRFGDWELRGRCIDF
ncbi:MAG: succinate dehydrogenase assembly factor 4 [Steroidobacteraceae bacterium]